MCELPRPEGRSFPHRCPTTMPTPTHQPEGWWGRYWLELHRHTGWHPPCTLRKNQASVEVPVRSKPAVGAAEHPVLQSQVAVDPTAPGALAGGVVRWDSGHGFTTLLKLPLEYPPQLGERGVVEPHPPLPGYTPPDQADDVQILQD